MPRKSRERRLNESRELYAAYITAQIEATRGGTFLRDMIARQERGKGMSKGQRNWLDSLIEEGIPQPKGDQVLLARIDEAIETAGMENSKEVLIDFRRKVFNDWKLSAKQAKWLDDMLAKAKDCRVNGPWRPDDAALATLRDCIALSKGYSGGFWSTHGGAYSAVQKAAEYITLIDKGDLDGSARVGLDQWCINMLTKTMAGRLRELREKPYVTAGQLIWVNYRDTGSYNTPFTWFRVPVCGDAEVSNRGAVVYPVLSPVEGLILVDKNRLAKRKPKGY